MPSVRLRLTPRRLWLLGARYARPPVAYGSLRVGCASLPSARLRTLRVACGSLAWPSAKSVGANAPAPRLRRCQPSAPASPSAPRATYRTQSQPVQFGNECRIRFPVDRDTGIQSTLHRIPLEGHRIENRTSYWWGLTVFSLLYKTRS